MEWCEFAATRVSNATRSSGTIGCERASSLSLPPPRQDHENRSEHQQERPQPGHAEISYSMQIEYRRYDCPNQEQESNQAENWRVHKPPSGSGSRKSTPTSKVN